MSDDVFRWVIAAAVILATIAFLIQAGVVVALYRLARKMQSRVLPVVDRAAPILDTTRKILDENRPKIAGAASDAAGITRSARVQVDRIGELLGEVTDRARARVAQIDETVDHTVEQVEQAGDAMKSALVRPLREVNGILSGVKAAITTYAQGGQRSSVDHATQDEEMFI